MRARAVIGVARPPQSGGISLAERSGWPRPDSRMPARCPSRRPRDVRSTSRCAHSKTEPHPTCRAFDPRTGSPEINGQDVQRGLCHVLQDRGRSVRAKRRIGILGRHLAFW